ncbi:MAG: DUF4869 domain-containing protein [Lachnospiraceae bacterium]|nr:DUF4869 domain-containing protein [Lachnospiraceae bacterium]
MLHIYYGEMEGVINNTEVYFRNTYDPSWIVDDLAKEIILDVDRSVVLGERCIQSRVLGMIPPEDLSGGTKTLLLMINDDTRIFNASTCGDNCAKWILKIAEKKDLTIRLGHIMDFGEGMFQIHVLNNDQIVTSMADLVIVAHNCLQETVV